MTFFGLARNLGYAVAAAPDRLMRAARRPRMCWI
jgi:hypothetical protein